jgi:hypothetical protein
VRPCCASRPDFASWSSGEHSNEDGVHDYFQCDIADKFSYGYNAATGEYGDMLEAGTLDPTKVSRLALQNAASVADLLLTTEVMIADASKDEAEHGHGGGGGGMGDMGGMGM